jgi:hypothetical protein
MRYVILTLVALVISTLAPITAIILLCGLFGAYRGGWGIKRDLPQLLKNQAY